MDDLRLQDDLCTKDDLKVEHQGNFFRLAVTEDDVTSLVYLSLDDARRLRDWLDQALAE